MARDRTLRRYLPPEVAAKHMAIEALLRELPGYWLPAEDIAPCINASLQATAKICVSLATEGLLECRVITRTAARCRTRKRREFRFAENRAQWPRHPVWLEPALHPVNQSACRRITGRVTLKEQAPMNDSQYRALPRNVREKFSSLRDDQFAGYPDVVAARQRVDAAEAAHRSACEAAHQLRTRKVQIDNLAQALQAQRKELHNSRIQHVADALVTRGAVDVSREADRQLAGRISDIDLVLEAAPRAQSDVDAQLVAVNRRIQLAANDCQSAAEDHRATLDALKLAAAQA